MAVCSAASETCCSRLQRVRGRRMSSSCSTRRRRSARRTSSACSASSPTWWPRRLSTETSSASARSRSGLHPLPSFNPFWRVRTLRCWSLHLNSDLQGNLEYHTHVHTVQKLFETTVGRGCSANVQVRIVLDRYKDVDSLADAFTSIPFSYGSGNLADALKTARTQMFR